MNILYFFNSLFYFFRQEKYGRINELLNDIARRKRKKKLSVSIQISALTWILEFFTGVLMLISFLIPYNVTLLSHLGFFDIILSFVLIPATYILNTEVIKALFIQNGWFRSFRSFIVSNRVQPILNEAVNNPNNHNG